VILLDTNVVSEPMRPDPDRNVLAWLDGQAAESLYLSTVSLEILAFDWQVTLCDFRACNIVELRQLAHLVDVDAKIRAGAN
jgi:predicted nucleic acid-binding protein